MVNQSRRLVTMLGDIVVATQGFGPEPAESRWVWLCHHAVGPGQTTCDIRCGAIELFLLLDRVTRLPRPGASGFGESRGNLDAVGQALVTCQ